MPRTRKTQSTEIADAVLDQFAGPARPMSAADVETVMRRFKKALMERMLGGELTHHLGYPPGGQAARTRPIIAMGPAARRCSPMTDRSHLTIPRDRAGTFEPQLIPKHARRFTGFDDKILALYARGMTVREIQAFLREMYARGGLARPD